MGNRRLTKNQLIKKIEFYEDRIQLLDIMLNDMSDIKLSDIQDWLDTVQSYRIDSIGNSYMTVYDKAHYKELKLFEDLQ